MSVSDKQRKVASESHERRMKRLDDALETLDFVLDYEYNNALEFYMANMIVVWNLSL